MRNDKTARVEGFGDVLQSQGERLDRCSHLILTKGPLIGPDAPSTILVLYNTVLPKRRIYLLAPILLMVDD